MQELSFDDLVGALKAIGIRSGDGLLTHSAVQYLGRPKAPSTNPNTGLAMIFNAILAVITNGSSERTASAGTLAVPTFNFGFARGERYDPRSTPSVGMGAFSEYVRQRPEALRTSHPMQSLAIVGRWAQDLAGRDTASAFDPGSAFERILELDFRLLLLGADIQAVSMLHYSEQKAQVPYRYWKEFSGSILTPQGWTVKTYRMFARDSNVDAQIDLHPVQAYLEAHGLWDSSPLNYGQVASCRLVDFVTAVDHFLQTDPWSLVTNR
jgi:aminoglycoside 3-N-acetyltransferase